MPVVNPLWVAAMRRQWPLAGAAGVFLVFLLVNATLFRPAADRYQAALKRAADLGLSLEPTSASAVVPPKVYALLASNALPSAVAKENGDSGALSASLIEAVSRLAANRRMEIQITEPGPTSQQPQATVVRAHLRATSTYATFLGLLEDLAASDKLLAVDRFTLQPAGPSDVAVDLYVSRYILKQAPVKP
jgi:hypothetical protein